MARKRIVRRLFITLIIVAALLLGAIIAIPYFFKDDIIAAIKKTANETMTATLDFGDVDISLLKNFPLLTLSIKDLSVVGRDQFDGLPLYRAANTSLAVDLKSAWKARHGGPLHIRKVVLDKPDIRIVVLPDGKANYDVTKSSGDGGETRYHLLLKSYELRDAHIVYDDRSIKFFLELDGLNHHGTGQFTEKVFDLDTRSTADRLTMKYGGIPYLSKVHAKLDAVFHIDNKKSKYSLKDNDLTLNDLHVITNGFVQLLPKDVTRMDLSFKAPSNSFKALLSVLPAAYTADFAQVTTKGQFALSGSVKGDLGPGESDYPALQFDLDVKDGLVKYPDLPLPVSDIQVQTQLRKPQGDMDLLTVDLPHFQLNVGPDPVRGRLHLTHPLTDPNVDAQVRTLLHLENVAKAWPLPDVKELAGLIDADVLLKARQSQLTNGAYDAVTMKGKMAVSDLIYSAAGMPRVFVENAVATFSPRFVDVPQFDLQLGKSDLKGSARIDNLLAYISPKQTMKGRMQVQAQLLDLNEWMSSDTTHSTGTVENSRPFDRFDFALDARADKVLYDTYVLRNTRVKGRSTSNKLHIADFQTQIGESDLGGSGELSNLFGYLFENQTLIGDLKLRSSFFDVNAFMDTDAKGGRTDDPAASEAAFIVPDKMDIRLAGKFDKVRYDTYDLTNVDGQLHMADHAISFDHVVAGFLGGKMALSGTYDTHDETAPAFDLRYAMHRMRFRQLYQKMVTFRKLAPIAKFIDGVFNTKLQFKGRLGEDMMPDLSALTAAGFLETVNGKITGLEPLQKIATTLDVPELEKLTIQNTKNWFEIRDGKLQLKPFELHQQDIAMKVAGYSRFGEGMNVEMTLKIPRKKLEANAAGRAAGKGLDLLRAQAAKLGVNISKSEFVNVKAILTGKLDKPRVKVQLLGGSGRSIEETAKETAKEVVKQAKDSLQRAADRELEKAKARAKAEADKAIDSAKAVVKHETEKAIEKAKDEVTKKVGEQVGKAANDKAKDILKDAGVDDKADDVINKGKDILDKWNPFKKKKKKN